MVACISLRRNIALLTPVVFVAVLSVELLRPADFINHDVAWFTMVGGEVLRGAELYHDYIEPNAPLAALSMAPASVLRNVAGISLPAAVTIWVYVIVAIAFALTVIVTRRMRFRPAQLLVLQSLILAAMVLTPGNAFGQREHLLAVLLGPYVICAALRGTPGAMKGTAARLTGLVAAIGVGMKPPLVLAVGAVELASLIRTRRPFNPESIALASALVAYAVITWIAFPGFFAIFFSWGTSLYAAYSAMPGATFRLVVLMILGIALLAWRDPHSAPEIHAARWLFAAAAIGSMGAFLLQWKGWFYQGYPAAYFALLCGVFSIAGLLQATPSSLTRIVVAAVMLGASYLHAPLFLKFHEAAGRRELRPVLSGVDGPFMALSTSVASGFPLGAENPHGWAFRYPCLILMPGLVRAAAENGGITPERYRAVEADFRAAIVEDMRQRAPAVVAIPRGTDQALPQDVKVFDWLMMDDAFANMLSSYVETDGTTRFRVFRQLR